MSLILDALNKAQREREEQREPVPQLSTVHYTPPLAQVKRTFNLQGIALGLGALLVAFLGGLWLSLGGEDNPAPVAVVTAPPVSVKEPSPATLQQGTPAPSDPAPTPVQQPAAKHEVAGLYRAAQKAEDEPQAEVRAVEAVTNTAPETRQTAVSAPPQVPDTSNDSIATRTDIPGLQELSWAKQQKLPSINYAEHHYTMEPGSRTVIINGAVRRAGAQIARGLILEEILRDGIILRYQNQQFKLPALSSWVNFR